MQVPVTTAFSLWLINRGSTAPTAATVAKEVFAKP